MYRKGLQQHDPCLAATVLGLSEPISSTDVESRLDYLRANRLISNVDQSGLGHGGASESGGDGSCGGGNRSGGGGKDGDGGSGSGSAPPSPDRKRTCILGESPVGPTPIPARQQTDAVETPNPDFSAWPKPAREDDGLPKTLARFALVCGVETARDNDRVLVCASSLRTFCCDHPYAGTYPASLSLDPETAKVRKKGHLLMGGAKPWSKQEIKHHCVLFEDAPE